MRAGVRKRLFRAVASPGAVLRDGALAGMWRARAGRGDALEFEVERLAPLNRDELDLECTRVAKVRGADGFELSLS